MMVLGTSSAAERPDATQPSPRSAVPRGAGSARQSADQTAHLGRAGLGTQILKRRLPPRALAGPLSQARAAGLVALEQPHRIFKGGGDAIDPIPLRWGQPHRRGPPPPRQGCRGDGRDAQQVALGQLQ